MNPSEYDKLKILNFELFKVQLSNGVIDGNLCLDIGASQQFYCFECLYILFILYMIRVCFLTPMF